MGTMPRNEPLTQPPNSTPDDSSPGAPAPLSRSRAIPPFLRWLAAAALVVVVLIVSLLAWGPGMDFPSEVNRQQTDGSLKSVEISRIISKEIKNATEWMVRNWGGMFDGIDFFITYTMVAFEDFLKWLPWPALFVAVTALAFGMGGWRLALLALLSMQFIGSMNRWDSAMETLAIIIFSVVASVLIALPLGILGARSDRFDTSMRPILDAMQTMPSYVYLVPGILFFGLGYTPAVIATVIYAVPPAIRLTNLGIRQVPVETTEAALSFGASSFQLLTKVQLPIALPTIMAGVNQTTMMALSMVVIASMIGSAATWRRQTLVPALAMLATSSTAS